MPCCSPRAAPIQPSRSVSDRNILSSSLTRFLFSLARLISPPPFDYNYLRLVPGTMVVALSPSLVFIFPLPPHTRFLIILRSSLVRELENCFMSEGRTYSSRAESNGCFDLCQPSVSTSRRRQQYTVEVRYATSQAYLTLYASVLSLLLTSCPITATFFFCSTARVHQGAATAGSRRI